MSNWQALVVVSFAVNTWRGLVEPSENAHRGI